LPISLIPLETERLLINEKLLPGISKILRIAQNFPVIESEPGTISAADIQTASSIFVYSSDSPGKNATLNLIKSLPAPSPLSETDLHNLRLEFVKKVFSSYASDPNAVAQSDENDIDRFDSADAVKDYVKQLLIALDGLSQK